jgi:hypothetical protein
MAIIFKNSQIKKEDLALWYDYQIEIGQKLGIKMLPDDDYVILDQLFMNRDKNSFSIGFEGNKILNRWMLTDRFSQENDRVPLRTVLTALLDELAGYDLDGTPHPGRYTRFYASVESARDRIATYIRVTRFFDADRCAELPQFPQPVTFSVLSACLVGGEWPYADDEKTMERLLWSLENRANPTQIYDHFLGREGETAETKILRRLVKICEKYLALSEKVRGDSSELAKQIRAILRYIQHGETR